MSNPITISDYFSLKLDLTMIYVLVGIALIPIAALWKWLQSKYEDND